MKHSRRLWGTGAPVANSTLGEAPQVWNFEAPSLHNYITGADTLTRTFILKMKHDKENGISYSFKAVLSLKRKYI